MKPSDHSLEQRSVPEQIRRMFDAIAPTYDFLNHLMSFGLDHRWRRKAIRLFGAKRGGVFLDIAAGSGDVSFDLMELRPQRIVGIDFAPGMLDVFRGKLSRCNHSSPVDIVSGDALSLPFRNESFDGTIVAFGIRNFADRSRALTEMFRVLKPGGISVILECTKPDAPVISQLYATYSRWGVPLLGSLISKHKSAYAYLPDSISHFPSTEEFLSLMEHAGFAEPRETALSFGAATIFTGRKLPATE
ncbi:MAG TPA: bifunctional demethylmenaquinone methyltransferase/2-methoxy-6-polyprenyl-1,4-benzoquinol methylase UbiE [Bacteroidota bacterium]|jgi:demethylmenaquinone methyltransferase/2-methoxy-6-polyprenyl-1,4-benzoquinol methylase|nr:bifunctional demethylmenaquinone methyltransferase/2-methoxy-6-polyprenyl-1,4-benzoquinol methylase UbiE [Bacteroidota bacterium]